MTVSLPKMLSAIIFLNRPTVRFWWRKSLSHVLLRVFSVKFGLRTIYDGARFNFSMMSFKLNLAFFCFIMATFSLCLSCFSFFRLFFISSLLLCLLFSSRLLLAIRMSKDLVFCFSYAGLCDHNSANSEHFWAVSDSSCMIRDSFCAASEYT